MWFFFQLGHFLGRVGITLDSSWEEPENPDDSTHHEASDTKIEFDFGWFAHPILVDGTYPPVMREKVLPIMHNLTTIRPAMCTYFLFVKFLKLD